MGSGASAHVYPLQANDVLVDLDVALRNDQTIEDNRKETVAVLRRLSKLKNVGDRDLLDTCILLQEAKGKKGKAAQEPGTSSPPGLTQADIDHQIRIYNTERICVVIDHGIRGLYPDDSWITVLKSGQLRNVEMSSNEPNFVHEYLDEFWKRRTEKENKEDTTDPTNIFGRRLNRDEIQDSIDQVNCYQSVVTVMRSTTPQELMASMRVKYVGLTEDVKGKKEQTFESYHELLTQSKKKAGSQKDLYMRVTRNDNVTGEDIEECLKEIRRITAHHDAIVRINQVISKQNTKGLMAALQDQHAELELPSPSEEIAEREREYQMLLYEAYTDMDDAKDDVLKAHKGTDVRMEKDDIQKVLLTNNVLVDLDVALRNDQTIEDNRKETIAVLRRLSKLKNVGDRDLLDTCILLQEAKGKKGKAEQEPGASSPPGLTQADIDRQIRIYNTERICVVIDHGIRGLYPDDSWITVLKSGQLRNVEMSSNEPNFVHEYLGEFWKRRTEKENKEDTTDPTNIFGRRLNRDEIQDSIDQVNCYQSVVTVMRSTTPQELMASMRVKYVGLTEDVKGKKEQTFESYHKLLTQSKKKAGSQKDLYMRVTRNDNVTGEDIEECLKEIRRITAHHDAIVRINQVISKQNTKGLMAALQDQHAELELPSPSEEIAERAREYQMLLYEAYTDKGDAKDDILKAHKGTDVRMEKDDIQKVLLSLDILQEIDTLEDTQTKKLLEYLRKDEMDIKNYIVDNMECCYATLVFEKRDKKRKDTSYKNSFKFLTRREVKDIVKEFKAVWDIQRIDSQKLKGDWDKVLRDAKLDPNDFEKLEGYRKLFKEDIEHKKLKREVHPQVVHLKIF